MRLILISFLLIFVSAKCDAAIYTFQVEGDYTNPSNWDTYPGTMLTTNDTISIEANCWSISLDVYDGYVRFTENCGFISVLTLRTYNNSTIEIMSENFNIDIYSSMHIGGNNDVIFPSFCFLTISNSGSGIIVDNCMNWFNALVIYSNWGAQDATFLECMDGSFINDGIVEVWNSFVFLNCELDLSSGTIEGVFPFDLYQFSNSLSQQCNGCTATINNIENLYLSTNGVILGTVILNAPD